MCLKYAISLGAVAVNVTLPFGGMLNWMCPLHTKLFRPDRSMISIRIFAGWAFNPKKSNVMESPGLSPPFGLTSKFFATRRTFSVGRGAGVSVGVKVGVMVRVGKLVAGV